MKPVSTFRLRLIEAIQDSGMSQNEVARRSGIDKALLSKYVNGIIQTSNKKLAEIAKALDVNPVWLLGFDVNKRNINTTTKEFDSTGKRVLTKMKDDKALCIKADELLDKLDLLDYDSLEFINRILSLSKNDMNKLSKIEETLFENLDKKKDE